MNVVCRRYWGCRREWVQGHPGQRIMHRSLGRRWVPQNRLVGSSFPSLIETPPMLFQVARRRLRFLDSFQNVLDEPSLKKSRTRAARTRSRRASAETMLSKTASTIFSASAW